MASSAEAASEGPSDFNDVEAHYAGRMLRAIIEGEPCIFIHPDNFVGIYDAYRHNLDGEKSERLEIQYNQEFLIGTENGRIVTDALDRLQAHEDEEGLQLIMAKAYASRTPEESAYFHSLILDMAAVYLPEGYDKAFLRNPWATDMSE